MRLNRFLIETVPVLAGLYSLIFLSNVASWSCRHSMFWSLYPSCLELGLVSGILASLVVGLGAARPVSTLTVFSGVSFLFMIAFGFLEAGRVGYGVYSALPALLSYLPNVLGVISGALVIVAARRLYKAKRNVPAACLVTIAIVITAIIAWRALPDLPIDTARLQWLGLSICAFLYGVLVRRGFLMRSADLKS